MSCCYVLKEMKTLSHSSSFSVHAFLKSWPILLLSDKSASLLDLIVLLGLALPGLVMRYSCKAESYSQCLASIALLPAPFADDCCKSMHSAIDIENL